jgi:hypothetical protein
MGADFFDLILKPKTTENKILHFVYKLDFTKQFNNTFN